MTERRPLVLVSGGMKELPSGDTLPASKSGQRLALLDPTDNVTPTDLEVVAFTSGGTYEIVAGDVITGATSAKTATVWLVYTTSGTWAGGDAAGWLFLSACSGALVSENLNVGANTNVATIGGDSTPNLATWDARAQIPVLDFDATTPEVVWLQGHMDYSYAGSGINVVLHVSATSATSGTAGWLIAFRRIGNGAQDVDLTTGWGASKTVTAENVPGTSGTLLIHTALAFAHGAEMDSIAAGEIFQVALIRDVDHDTASGDTELVLCEIREQ